MFTAAAMPDAHPTDEPCMLSPGKRLLTWMSQLRCRRASLMVDMTLVASPERSSEAQSCYPCSVQSAHQV